MAKKKSAPQHVLPVNEILRRLYDFGYFGAKSWSVARKISGAELQKAVAAYQRFHGLNPTGEVEAMTAHKINHPRCGLPDFNITAPDGKPCKWPMEKISYYHELTLPGMNDEQISEAYDIAFSQWAEVCNIEPVRVDNNKMANIYARSGVGKKNGLDNRGGTLAWSELPCGVAENIQLDQMFDEAEEWNFNMAVAVICHELGHALGLPHLAAGNLMAPYYDPNVSAPRAGDIAEIVKLYGKRRRPYPLKKDAAISIHGTITINGRPYRLVPKS